MTKFFLAHYDKNGNPLGKNYLPMDSEHSVVLTSSELSEQEIEQLEHFSRWYLISK